MTDYNGARGVIWGCLIAIAAWPVLIGVGVLLWRLVVRP